MTKKHPLTSSAQDYLKEIHRLGSTGAVVTVTAVATATGVSAASATIMIKRLASLGLLKHAPYHGVTLTHAGEKVALEIVRHHRLIELFLSEALGMPWDQVHEEAHKLEHVLSDNLENRIADYLGNPTMDPHGDPIPTKTGAIPASSDDVLADLAPGTTATVRRVGAQDPARLRYLQGIGLVPGVSVELIGRSPFEGPVRIRVKDEKEDVLDLAFARQIGVSKSPRGRKANQV